MSNAKHTPGPWGLNGNIVTCAVQPNGKHTVATTWTRADARLIAAAPALLEALESIVSEIDGWNGSAENLVKALRYAARAAIASAIKEDS